MLDTEPTFKGRYFGIPILFSPDTEEIYGQNTFYGIIIHAIQPIEKVLSFICSLFFVNAYIPIVIDKEPI